LNYPDLLPYKVKAYLKTDDIEIVSLKLRLCHREVSDTSLMGIRGYIPELVLSLFIEETSSNLR